MSSIPSLGQVLLVAGGYSASQQRAGRELATTELLLPGRAAWALVGSLPASMHGLRAAAVDNRVFMFGEEEALVINTLTKLSVSTLQGVSGLSRVKMAPLYSTGFWSLTVISRYGRRLAKCHREELSTRCRPSGSRISADFVISIILLTSNKNLNYFAFPSRQKGLENNASISSRDFPCINSVRFYNSNIVKVKPSSLEV